MSNFEHFMEAVMMMIIVCDFRVQSRLMHCGFTEMRSSSVNSDESSSVISTNDNSFTSTVMNEPNFYLYFYFQKMFKITKLVSIYNFV